MVTGQDPGEFEIDHIDRDKSNNRFSNLRLAERKNNNDNVSGKKGIRFIEDRGKWIAQVRHHGKMIYFGCHDCPLMARLAYIDGKRSLAGEFSPV